MGQPDAQSRARPPWQNPAYVLATLAQGPVRARWRPERAYGLRELRRHLFAGADGRAREDGPYLAVATLILDEATDIVEWIEFHRLQGVERFFLYDNGSRDGIRDVVAAYVEQGVVEIIPWAQPGAQHAAVADCLRRHRDDVRWLAMIDVDEFLFCPTGERLSDVLREYEHYPALVAHWHMFGTSGLAERVPDADVLSMFTRRSDDFGWISVNKHFKSIVNPRCAFDAEPPSGHHQPYRVGLAVNEVGTPVHGPWAWPIRADRLRINHYWTKSEADARRKLARSPSGIFEQHKLDQFLDPALNAVEDRTILRVRDQLRRSERASPAAGRSPQRGLGMRDLVVGWGAVAYWLLRYIYLPRAWQRVFQRPG